MNEPCFICLKIVALLSYSQWYKYGYAASCIQARENRLARPYDLEKTDDYTDLQHHDRPQGSPFPA